MESLSGGHYKRELCLGGHLVPYVAGALHLRDAEALVELLQLHNQDQRVTGLNRPPAKSPR